VKGSYTRSTRSSTIQQQYLAKLQVQQYDDDKEFTIVMAWNGLVLCAGGNHGPVYFWDLQSSEGQSREDCFRVLAAPKNNVCSLVRHADFTQLASSVSNHLVLLHNTGMTRQVDSYIPCAILCGHSGAVKALT
jgi:hypothetical protein